MHNNEPAHPLQPDPPLLRGTAGDRPSLTNGLLLEGVVTTLNADGTPHLAPMGPIVDAEFARLLLRPFRTSATYANLKRSRTGVLHITDDVELIAHSAVGTVEQLPRFTRPAGIEGVVLSDACRWYAFEIDSVDDRIDRAEMIARVTRQGRIRDFCGFNRAKHAVVEAAILASRLTLLDQKYISQEFDRLSILVEKTGGPQERRAFAFLRSHCEGSLMAGGPVGKQRGEP